MGSCGPTQPARAVHLDPVTLAVRGRACHVPLYSARGLGGGSCGGDRSGARVSLASLSLSQTCRVRWYCGRRAPPRYYGSDPASTVLCLSARPAPLVRARLRRVITVATGAWLSVEESSPRTRPSCSPHVRTSGRSEGPGVRASTARAQGPAGWGDVICLGSRGQPARQALQVFVTVNSPAVEAP